MVTVAIWLVAHYIITKQQEVESLVGKWLAKSINLCLCYVFYNSLCLDYVTERYNNNFILKISILFLYNGLIIIQVLWSNSFSNHSSYIMDPHGSHAKVAPPHSFINVCDFLSIRHLADYLKKLDKKDTLYNEYFWWKKHYKIRNAVLYSVIFLQNLLQSMCGPPQPWSSTQTPIFFSILMWKYIQLT